MVTTGMPRSCLINTIESKKQEIVDKIAEEAQLAEDKLRRTAEPGWTASKANKNIKFENTVYSEQHHRLPQRHSPRHKFAKQQLDGTYKAWI